jgi:hypothetical protein
MASPPTSDNLITEFPSSRARLFRPRWLVFGAVVLVVSYCIWHVLDLVYGTIPDMYAQQWVAGMVIGYMETHDDRWPQAWDDLQKPYERAVARVGRPWNFQQLRDRVIVDFTADPSTLAMAVVSEGRPPFRVIRLRSGKQCYWETKEPNSMIWGYLTNKELLEHEPSQSHSAPHEE